MERKRLGGTVITRLIQSGRRTSSPCRSGAGFTLLEVVIALAVLGISALAFAGVFAMGASTSHAQSDQSQAVVICQSKLEQLRTLSFGDTESDTTQPAPYPCTGTGLAPGGSTSQAVSGYSDYVDASGDEVSQSASQFERFWDISDPSGNLDTIAVYCKQINSVSPLNVHVTLTTEKTDNGLIPANCP